jgi:LysM repeat protein
MYAESMVVVVEKGDTLQGVAKDFDASWKTIAKLNKLKAPYHIEVGQKLKIPATETTNNKDDKKFKKHKK